MKPLFTEHERTVMRLFPNSEQAIQLRVRHYAMHINRTMNRKQK